MTEKSEGHWCYFCGTSVTAEEYKLAESCYIDNDKRWVRKRCPNPNCHGRILDMPCCGPFSEDRITPVSDTN